MDENKYKESIDNYIGEEKLFNEQLKNSILNEVRKKKHKRRAVYMFRKFIPIMGLLFLLGCGTVFYISSTTSDKQVVSSPNEGELVATEQGNEESSSTYFDTDQAQFKETLNMSFRVIDAMINKDYEYLENIITPSVTLNKEDNSITFGEMNYKRQLITGFDYRNFEFRGYMIEGNQVLIILGVYNVSYYFEFVEGKSKYGNYLLKSLYTN